MSTRRHILAAAFALTGLLAANTNAQGPSRDRMPIADVTMDRRLNICHISTLSPTQCGIATYVEDLIESLPGVDSTLIRLVRDQEGAGEVRRTISVENKESYEQAVHYINDSHQIDLVSIQ